MEQKVEYKIFIKGDFVRSCESYNIEEGILYLRKPYRTDLKSQEKIYDGFTMGFPLHQVEEIQIYEWEE